MLFPSLQPYFDSLNTKYLPYDRRVVLDPFQRYILEKVRQNESINLTFLCTHNSRRSHLAQVWAQTAAYACGFSDVHCYSGGTEATACNPRTVAALERAGFVILRVAEGENPVYEVHYAQAVLPVVAFSKEYTHPANPAANFAAIMTCTQADELCPYIPGSERRIPVVYDDPKVADGTSLETPVYDERCRQIATEMKYLFDMAPPAAGA